MIICFNASLKHCCVLQTEKQLQVQRKGGELTLCRLAQDFSDKVPEELPALWENTTKYLNDGTGKTGVFSLRQQ